MTPETILSTLVLSVYLCSGQPQRVKYHVGCLVRTPS